MLVPAFALRHENDFGIGDTEAVRQAVTFCAEQKMGLLQLLPVNETGADNSPYNAISSVALDPIYAALTPEQVPGLMPETLAELFPESVRAEWQSGPVRYGLVKQLKLEALSHAYVEFEAVDLETESEMAAEFKSFVDANSGWLPGYTLFRTLVNEYNSSALWPEWIPEHRSLASAEAWLLNAPERDELVRYRQFTAYVQWVMWRQWTEVRMWADQNKVRLIGDIPFGVSRYSADVWSERDLFNLTWSGGAPAEPYFAGMNFCGAGARTGHPSLRLGGTQGARFHVVAAARLDDEPDFPRLPDRSCPGTLPALQFSVDAAGEPRFCRPD